LQEKAPLQENLTSQQNGTNTNQINTKVFH